MRELATDSEQVVLLFELEYACLQVIGNALGHLLALCLLSHLVFINKT